MISVHVITCYQGVKLQLINTDTGVCDHHAKWHIFHQEALSLANAILVFQVDLQESSLHTLITSQNHLGSELVNLEDLSSKIRIISSKPAVLVCSVSSCFVSFIYIFFLGTQDVTPQNVTIDEKCNINEKCNNF